MIQTSSISIIDVIHRLIRERGYVIVPAWGTFFCHPIQAQWDEHTHTFLPPHYSLSFNPSIQQSDGILELTLAQQLNYTYSETVHLLSSEMENWHSQLIQYGKLSFGELGEFVHEKDEMIFSSSSLHFDSPDFFGLSPLHLETNDDETRLVFSYPASKATYSWLKVAVMIPFFVALALIPSKVNKYTSSKTQTTSIVKQISWSNITNNPTSMEQAIDTITSLKVALQMPEKSENINSEPVKNNSSTLANMDVKKENTVKEPSSNNEINHTKSQKQFYIIVASFVEKDRVNLFLQELSNQNIDGNMLNCNGKLRVSIGSYTSHEKAQTALSLFKQQHPTYTGWILFW